MSAGLHLWRGKASLNIYHTSNDGFEKKNFSCELCITHIFDFITSNENQFKKLMSFMNLFLLLFTMT